MDKVEIIVLLRASELTIENGSDFFEVLDSNRRIKTAIVSTPTQTITTHKIGQPTTSQTYGGSVTSIDKPIADITIKIFKYSDLNTSEEELKKNRNYGKIYFIAEETKKYLSQSL